MGTWSPGTISTASATWGDAWWSSPEEILADLQGLSTVAFLKKYKGF